MNGNMESKALRVGNFIYAFSLNDKKETDLRLAVVKGIADGWIDYKYDGEFNHCSYKYVPLTEEWFLRFGFKETGDFLWRGNFSYNKETKIFHWFGVILHDILIKYVHQLQNLYFALTGTEL